MAAAATTASSSSTPHVDRLNFYLEKTERNGDKSMMQKVIELAKQIGINEANYLQWQERHTGFTGYIDGITTEDLQGKKLVWGYDRRGCPFITFRCKITTEDTAVYETSTLFQLWPNSGDGVYRGGGYRQFYIDLGDEGNSLKNLETLFKGQTVTQIQSDDTDMTKAIERKITLISDSNNDTSKEKTVT